MWPYRTSKTNLGEDVALQNVVTNLGKDVALQDLVSNLGQHAVPSVTAPTEQLKEDEYSSRLLTYDVSSRHPSANTPSFSDRFEQSLLLAHVAGSMYKRHRTVFSYGTSVDMVVRPCTNDMAIQPPVATIDG